MTNYYNTFLVYTTREGGKFAWKNMTPKEWERVKETGVLQNALMDTSEMIVYGAFVEVKEDKDFIVEAIMEKRGKDRSLSDSKE